jgi:tetratricopeptide (TPR) repeat protein
LAERLGEQTVLARAHTLLGHLALPGGHTAQAIQHFQAAFELYARAGHLHGQGIALNQIANAQFRLGQWSDAENHYRRARDIFIQTDNVYDRSGAENNLGGIALNRGKISNALRWYQVSLRKLEQTDKQLWLIGLIHNNLGATHIRRGDAETAYQHLRLSEDYFTRAGHRAPLPELRRHWAEATLLAGNLPEAEAQARQAQALAHELEDLTEEGASLRVLGEVAAARQKLDQAESYLSQGIAILEQAEEIYETARTQLALATTCLAQGKVDATRAALAQCLSVFERLGAALDLEEARALEQRLA